MNEPISESAHQLRYRYISDKTKALFDADNTLHQRSYFCHFYSLTSKEAEILSGTSHEEPSEIIVETIDIFDAIKIASTKTKLRPLLIAERSTADKLGKTKTDSFRVPQISFSGSYENKWALQICNTNGRGIFESNWAEKLSDVNDMKIVYEFDLPYGDER